MDRISTCRWKVHVTLPPDPVQIEAGRMRLKILWSIKGWNLYMTPTRLRINAGASGSASGYMEVKSGEDDEHIDSWLAPVPVVPFEGVQT